MNIKAEELLPALKDLFHKVQLKDDKFISGRPSIIHCSTIKHLTYYWLSSDVADSLYSNFMIVYNSQQDSAYITKNIHSYPEPGTKLTKYTLLTLLNIKFFPEKLHYFEAIDWLTSETNENRQTGRTHLLALAYIKHAFERPDTCIYFQDHSLLSRKTLKNRIFSLLSKQPTISYDLQESSLLINR